MKNELEEKLFKKYPKLLRGRNKSLKENLLPFGFMTKGRGWYDLLDDLFSDLKKMNKDLEFDIEVVEVKEKFARLRCYINRGTEEIFDRIMEAEDESANICERCGTRENVEIRNLGGWYMTRCDECFKKTKQEKLSKFNKDITEKDVED